MWQRFTERARKLVFYSQEEAQKFGEGFVSTEHLLLALTREPETVAARVLEKLGVSLNRVRAEVEKQLPRGDARPSQDMTLTPRAKRVIDLAYDEARNLNNNYIGTEHIMLGLIREGDGLAGRVLAKLGIELENARREVMALQDNEIQAKGGGEAPTNQSPSPEPVQYRYKAIAADLVALLLLTDPTPELTSRLTEMGVDIAAVALALQVKIWSKSEKKVYELPSAADILDSRTGSMAVFTRIANHPATLLHRVLRDHGVTPDTIEASFPDEPA